LSIYADSSFLVSVYVRDKHTPRALRRMLARPSVWLTQFHDLEFAHAVAQQVFRKRFSADIADGVLADYARDQRAGLWTRTEFPIAAFETGVAFAHRHVARFGTRTLDTLHVAAALELGAKDFWTFDERQAKLAKAVGLKVT